MTWVRRGHNNPPQKGGARREHTRSAPEGAITLCAAGCDVGRLAARGDARYRDRERSLSHTALTPQWSA